MLRNCCAHDCFTDDFCAMLPSMVAACKACVINGCSFVSPVNRPQAVVRVALLLMLFCELMEDKSGFELSTANLLLHYSTLMLLCELITEDKSRYAHSHLNLCKIFSVLFPVWIFSVLAPCVDSPYCFQSHLDLIHYWQ